jgi:hypothetical protein
MEISKILLLILFLLATGGFCSASVQDEEHSKAIKAEVFIKQRPAKGRTPSTARYKRVSKSAGESESALPPGAAYAQLGVTLWRFRPATSADKTKELVEEDDGPATEWTLERIEEGTPLTPGQRVRLSIESLSRDGYLYVIDREQYADGTLGDPLLIFPTRKTADSNRVKAGQLIYIPSATGKFRIKPSEGSKGHIGEAVIIIVAPKPLINDDQLGPRAIKIPRQQLESWEAEWGRIATKFEMEGGAGQAMTRTEQTVGSDSSQMLTQDDPAPQTVYRVATKPDRPIIVTVPLKFARPN